ncbi:hypothetical protein NDU88_005679 [Pleurodeles waltl]|uniref:Uncharacterized protein n=1 Tax=Pleurodeles waltl TaxID=8319 RepID=A0AAV7TBC4_PLEWA|nr:hypothetical protein NDU88_005679 [Pleurodeles waltl]
MEQVRLDEPKALARNREDNARGPEIGVELHGYKERKPEGLQQGNDIPPLKTTLQTVIRMLEEPVAS